MANQPTAPQRTPHPEVRPYDQGLLSPLVSPNKAY